MATGKCGVFKRLGFDASRKEFDHDPKGNSSFNRSKLSRCRDHLLDGKDGLVSPLDGPRWVSREHEGLRMPPNKKQKYSPIIWDREGGDVRPSLKKTSPRKSPTKSPSSTLTDELGEKSALEYSTKQPSPPPQKQFVEYEQESGMVEDGEFIQERNILTSRWASDSDSPSYSYTSDDEIDRNRRKSDSGNSSSKSVEFLAGSTVQAFGSVGSVEEDNNLGVSGEDCIDDLEEENCDAMDVERNGTYDTDDDGKGMNHGDGDVFHGVEEQAGPPRRSVDMLCSCRSVFEYEKLNKINEGAYGVVYRARDKKTGEIVALKKVKMNVGDREGFPMSALREINILLSFDHPSVVDVKEVVMDDNNLDSVFMVMEYMEHDLKALMERRKRPFGISEVKCLMLQLLEGVKYLHGNWVLHRDLKTSNLLFNNKGELKICDFGLSRQYGSPLKPYTPLVVTLWYRAPELLLGAKEYSSAIDMWSVGCIMAELLGNGPLFKGSNEVNQLDKIFRTLGTPNEEVWPGFSKLPGAKAKFVNQPDNLLRKKFPVSPFMGSMHLSESGLDLMNRLLTYDPQKRITADEALKHEWFREVPLPSSRDFMPTFPPQHAVGR